MNDCQVDYNHLDYPRVNFPDLRKTPLVTFHNFHVEKSDCDSSHNGGECIHIRKAAQRYIRILLAVRRGSRGLYPYFFY